MTHELKHPLNKSRKMPSSAASDQLPVQNNLPNPETAATEDLNDHYENEWHPDVNDEEGEEDEDWSLHDSEERPSQPQPKTAHVQSTGLPSQHKNPSSAAIAVHQDHLLNQEDELSPFDPADIKSAAEDIQDYDTEETQDCKSAVKPT